MTVLEFVGLLLAVVGVAFAFETPRKWFLRVTGLRRLVPATQLPAEPGTTHQQIGSTAPTHPAIDSTSPTASSISVKDIVDEINAAPPLQQKEVSQRYADIPVQWVGYLRKAEVDFRDQSRVRVNLIVDNSRVVGYSIWFSEKLEHIPELKTLKNDSKLRVRGRILSASGPGLYVEIEPDEIEILERR